MTHDRHEQASETVSRSPKSGLPQLKPSFVVTDRTELNFHMAHTAFAHGLLIICQASAVTCERVPPYTVGSTNGTRRHASLPWAIIDYGTFFAFHLKRKNIIFSDKCHVEPIVRFCEIKCKGTKQMWGVYSLAGTFGKGKAMLTFPPPETLRKP